MAGTVTAASGAQTCVEYDGRAQTESNWCPGVIGGDGVRIWGVRACQFFGK